MQAVPPSYPQVCPPSTVTAPFPAAVLGTPPKNDGRATTALVLGIASMTCLGFLTGIPAIVLGSMARRDIDRSQGTRTGSGMAAAGMVTGLFGTGLSIIIAVAALGGALGELTGSGRAPAPRTESPVKVPIAAGTRSYGPLDVVDLDGEKTLKSQLVDVSRTAIGKGRTVVLQTYVRQSKECAQVAAALPDPKMQKALANVTLVRVDLDAFEEELKAMRVDTESVPWFYKLDATGRPTDAISGDEWDANTADNMAPVLSDFVRGRNTARRTPSPLGTSL